MVESKVRGEAQELLKKEKAKVICGTFKARNEALQRAAELRRAGTPVSLAIKGTEYSLFYAKDMTKNKVETVNKVIEAKKKKVEVDE